MWRPHAILNLSRSDCIENSLDLYGLGNAASSFFNTTVQLSGQISHCVRKIKNHLK